MKLKLCIMTPEDIIWNQEVEEVILPTTTGQIGILPNHSPIITGLDIGVLKLRSGSIEKRLVIDGGFALVKNDNTLLVLLKQAKMYDSSNPDFNSNVLQKTLLENQKTYQTALTSKEKNEALIVIKYIMFKVAFSNSSDTLTLGPRSWSEVSRLQSLPRYGPVRVRR